MLIVVPVFGSSQEDRARANNYHQIIHPSVRGETIVDHTYVWYKENYSNDDYYKLQNKVGWIYPINSIIEHVCNYVDGRPGYDVFYNTNEFGFRITSPHVKKQKHLIIGGDSNSFGVGVKDSEVINELMAAKNPTYSTYNFSHAGGGPHNTLAFFENMDWSKKIQEKSGHMIYIMYPAWMSMRVVGTKDFLAWDNGKSPWYELVNDQPVSKGLFRDRLLSKILAGIRFIDRFKWVGDLPKLNKEHMRLIAKIFEKMKAEYLSKLPEGHFTVAVSYYDMPGNPKLVEELVRVLRELKVDTVVINKNQENEPQYHLLDQHFNREGQKLIEKELSGQIKL